MASSNKRTIYLGLDYSQFTGGITEVNRKMSLLDQQFKLSEQEAKNYGNETDKLGVKQDYLTQKIGLQAQKVEAAKKAYEDAKNSQKATEKQLDALQKAYLKEETSLEKMKGSLKDTEDAQNKLNKTTMSFGDELRSIASQLGVNSPLVDKLASNFDGLNAHLGNVIVGLVGVGTQLVGFAKDAAQTADNLLTLATTSNMTTEELQKLQYASSFVDVEVSTMTGAITKLTSNMKSASEGNKDLNKTFKQLGIAYQDGQGHFKSANDVFYEAIDALGKIQNETARDTVAMTLFGKSAKELTPLIEAGSSRLEELGDEAERLGVIMSDDQLAKAGALQDSLDKFDSVLGALKNNLAMGIIPVLTTFIEAIANIPVPVLSTIAVIGTVVTTIIAMVKAIKEMTGAASAIKGFFNTFDIAANRTTLIVMGIVAAVTALLVLIAVLAGKGNQVNQAMNSVAGTVNAVNQSVQSSVQKTYQTGQHAYGTDNYKGGQTWVGEAGPELVTLPPGSKIESNESAQAKEINVFNITIDSQNIDEFNRIVELVKGQRMALRRA